MFTSRKVVYCILIMLIFPLACSANQSEPEVKSSDNLKSSPVSSNVERESLSMDSPEFYETLDNTAEYANQMRNIASACNKYRGCYGALPEKLSDLLDGFILIWPISGYSNKPFGIIDTMPDPNKPEHIGMVYYDRKSDTEGNLVFLNLDIDNYQPDSQGYMVEEIEIGSGGTFDRLSDDEREWWVYNRYVDNILRTRFISSIISSGGSLPNDFASMLTDNGFKQFRIVQSGLDRLKEGINKGKVTFEIGEVNNGELYYADENNIWWVDSDLKPCRLRLCMEIGEAWDDRTQKDITYVMPWFSDEGEMCPEGANFTGILFSSDEIENYEIPDNLIITKDEILGN